ncbi:MAG: MlaD family protein [Chitinophagales bacterium]
MSKEIKVAGFVIISILIAVFGSRFLLGQGILSSNNVYKIIFNDASGLYKSNLVVINGFKVGQVTEMEYIKEGENVGKILTTIDVEPEYEIPVGSKAILKSEGLMGDMLISLKLNNKSNKMIENNGFIASGIELGIVDDLGGKFGPVADNLNKTLENINELFDFEKQNVQSLNYTVENLNKLISTYGKTGTALNAKINDLGKTLDNLEGFTGTLNDKSESLGTSLDNIEQLTNNLKDIEVKQTLNNLQEATGKLNTALNAVNSSDNTVGALLNDKELYNDLDRAIVNLNLLLKDVRINPGRYITIQVFGKKNKEEPITEDEGYVK